MTAPRTPHTETGVLVVGAGEAGVRVAASLRELGYERPVLLLGDEPHPPYQRPPLSKAFLDGRIGPDGLALRTPDFFRESGIEMRTGRHVCAAEVGETGSGSARCYDGLSIAFDHLVLATGARARALPIAGAQLDGVCMLRTLNDAVELRERMAVAEQVVILGAGYIGLEAAATASHHGTATTVVEREDRVLSRVGGAPLSRFLQDEHSAWGVRFRLGAGVREIVGDGGGRVRGVRLTDDRLLPADLVIAGVGAVPETTLAERIGLEVRRGVVVGADARTSHPGVFAAGDCTVVRHPHRPGELIGIESVQNANDQGRAVAAGITGAALPPRPVPWFWSDQRDLKLQIAGVSNGSDQHVVRGSAQDRAMTVLYYRQGALIASESVNRPQDFMAVKRALGRSGTIEPERATDLNTPMRELIADRIGACR